jgi:protein involved in polysaccharide export with SLBB domain
MEEPQAIFKRNNVVVVMVLVLVIAVTGVAQQSPSGSDLVTGDRLPSVLSERYTIRVGDVLDITFFKTENMNQQVTVGPDGEVYLPLIGRVRVVGRTVDDVTKEITDGYRKEMIDPLITVSIAEFSGLEIYVSGEVQTPGVQPYRGGLTLVQAISAAGGFNRRARRQEVLLIRPGPDNQPVGTIVDVKEIQRKGQLSNDIPLAPLDIIYVHHKKIVNVNIFVEQYISDNIPRLEGWAFLFWGAENRD